MDWIWGVTRRKIKGDPKIVYVDNLKNKVAFWRRKWVQKEEIWREALKSEFRQGKFEVPIKYWTIKQLFGYVN